MELILNYILFALTSTALAYFTREDGRSHLLTLLAIAVFAGIFSASISWQGSNFYDRRVYSFWYEENFPLYLMYPEMITSSSQQPGWIAFNLACLHFSNNPEFLFFAVSFFYTFSVLLLFRAYDLSPFLTVLIFVTFPAVVYSAAWCRQMVAASLFAIALIALRKGRHIVSVVFVLLAASVHVTLIVMLPILVVGYIFSSSDSLNRTLVKVLVVLLIIAAIAGPTIITLLKDIPILQRFISLGSFEGDPGSLITVFKGLPYFLSLLLVCLNLSTTQEWRQNNASSHLLILAFGCTAWLTVFSVYWVVRLPVYAVPSTIILLGTQASKTKFFDKFCIACISSLSLLITLREIAVLF